ncbi:MAG: DNA internalization-related competence protein ComEC/Rec2 [Clostridia bacterium]|nr:DNA internalization-related competence protein ComEC/Rec2 [Clostridia bacterium]MDD4571098.1 DNA internalization-related competence protein ComEC/Rec2 [Clostridia bacterium]
MLSRLKTPIIKLWQLWTLPVLICAFGMGILCALLLPFDFRLIVILMVLALLCLILGFTKRLYGLFLVASLCTGFVWGAIDIEGLEREALLYPADTEIEIQGVVVDSPVLADKRLKLTVKPEDGNVKILVYSENIPVKYGDEVFISGKIAKNKQTLNEGAFDYNRYLFTNKIVATVFADSNGVIVTGEGKGKFFIGFALDLRERLEKAMVKLPEQQAKFVAGIVLGDKSALESSERQILSQTGIMHLFTVSGGNILYVIMLAMGLAGIFHIKRWGKFFMVVLFVALFSVMTGFSPPVLRSSIMAVIAAAAVIMGEKNDAPTALFIAAFLCLLWRPLFLFDAGFQLSFAATAGIIFTLDLWPKWRFSEFLTVTLAAQIAVAALTAYYFNVFTVVGLILSPIAVAMSGIIVILGLLSIPFSLIGCGDVPLYGAGFLAQLMFDGANFSNKIPGAYKIIASPDLFVLISYYILLIVAVWFLQQSNLKIKDKLFAIIPVVLALFLLFIPVKHSNTLEITFMDVGQGDGILIQTPAGNDILLDAGGNDFNLKGVGEYTVLPYLRRKGIDDIEVMINSHPHSDHAGGLLAVLEQMPVESLVLSNNYEDVALQEELLALATAKKVQVQYVYAGMVLNPEENLKITVYSPQQGTVYTEDGANRGSLVIKITYGEFDLLFTGDLDGAEQMEFIGDWDWSDIDYLQIPHHGSKNSYDELWYSKFAPQGVIISVGRNNSYGHPADEVINYWLQQGTNVYRTDKNGAVIINTDGTNWYVDTYIQ